MPDQFYVRNETAPLTITHLPSAYFGAWNQHQDVNAGINAKYLDTVASTGSQVGASKSWASMSKNTSTSLGCSQWLSDQLGSQTVSAANWTIAFAAKLPDIGDSGIQWAGYAGLYLVDGTTGNLKTTVFSLQTIGSTVRSTRTELSCYSTTISGSSFTASSGDYLAFEGGLRATTGVLPGTPDGVFYYDGSTSISSDAASVSNAQSFISPPVSLNLNNFAIGSGGISLSGAVPNFNCNAIGNIKLFGITSDVIIFNNFNTVGSISLIGISAYMPTILIPALGNITINGIASYQQSAFNYPGIGNISLLNAANYAETRVFLIGSGNISLVGQALAATTFWIGTGGIKLSGSATCVCFRQYVSSTSANNNSISATFLQTLNSNNLCIALFSSNVAEIGFEEQGPSLDFPIGFNFITDAFSSSQYGAMFYGIGNTAQTLTFTGDNTWASACLILFEVQGPQFLDVFSSINQNSTGQIISPLSPITTFFNEFAVIAFAVNNGNSNFTNNVITQCHETTNNLQSEALGKILLVNEGQYQLSSNITQDGNSTAIIATFSFFNIIPPQTASGGITIGNSATYFNANYQTYNASGNIILSGNASRVCRRQFAATSVTSQTSISLPWQNITLPSSLLTAIVSFNSGNGFTPPTGWTLAVQSVNSTWTCALYYISNAASQSSSVRFNFSGTFSGSLVIAEYEGINSIKTPIDTTAFAGSTVNNQALSSGITSVTTEFNEFDIAGIASGVISGTPTNNFNVISSQSNFWQLEKLVALKGQQSTSLPNFFGGFAGVIATFIESSGTVNYTGTGSVSLTGIASKTIIAQTFATPGIGSLQLGNVSLIKVITITKPVGNISLSGTALAFILITAKGSVSLSGIAQIGRFYLATGNASLSGISKLKTFGSFVGAGNISLTGQAKQKQSYKIIGSGSIKVLGSISINYINNAGALGILKLSGIALKKLSFALSTSGYIVLPGNNNITYIKKIYIASGNISLNNSSAIISTILIKASGGLLLSGKFSKNLIESFISSGSLIISGLAKNNPTIKAKMSGNITLSGGYTKQSIYKAIGKGSINLQQQSKINIIGIPDFRGLKWKFLNRPNTWRFRDADRSLEFESVLHA